MSAARWVEEGLSNNFAHVDALVPRGYAAYGRLFHPASGEDKRQVRWSEVAAWAGSVAHPLMAFEGVSAPKPGYGAGARPWLQEPMEDQMDEQDARALAVLLSGFTRTPQHCYFGIWDGFGQYSPGAMTLLTTSGGIPQTPPPDVIAAQGFDGVRREPRGSTECGENISCTKGPSRPSGRSSTTSGRTLRTSGGRRIEVGAWPRISI